MMLNYLYLLKDYHLILGRKKLILKLQEAHELLIVILGESLDVVEIRVMTKDVTLDIMKENIQFLNHHHQDYIHCFLTWVDLNI